MSIRGDVIRHAVWRRWLSQLLLTLFIARALFPAGFMPDFRRDGSAIFQVVICTAYGSKSVTLEADGKTVPGETAQHHDQPCAFSGLAFAILAAPQGAALNLPVFEVSAVAPPLAVTLPPSRAGPQLGSRGPPQIS